MYFSISRTTSRQLPTNVKMHMHITCLCSSTQHMGEIREILGQTFWLL